MLPAATPALAAELQTLLADPDRLFRIAPGDPALDALSARGRSYWLAARTPAVRTKHAACLREFVRWCAARRCTIVPTHRETVLTYLRECRWGSAQLYFRTAVINRLNCYFGFGAVASHPTIHALIIDHRQRERAARARIGPITNAQIAAMLTHCEHARNVMIRCRDRALLLVAFRTALPFAELAQLQLSDLHCASNGLRLVVRSETSACTHVIPLVRTRSKFCPVAALDAWLAVRGQTAGPLFCRADCLRPRPLGCAMLRVVIAGYARPLGVHDHIHLRFVRAARDVDPAAKGEAL